MPKLAGQREGKGLQHTGAVPALSQSLVLGNTSVSPRDCTHSSITRLLMLITTFYSSYLSTPGEVNWFSLPQPSGEGREAQTARNEFEESQGQAVPSPSAFPAGIEAGIAPWESPLPAAHPLLIFSNSSTHFNPNCTQRKESKGYFYAHQETCLWRGEQRQLLLRKTLQQELSLLLDTRADTEQQNFVGNLASLRQPLTVLLGLFCSGLEMLVGRRKNAF